MRYLTIILALLGLASTAPAQQKHTAPPPCHAEKDIICSPFNADHLKFQRGMKPTPRHKLLTAPRFRMTRAAIPGQVLMLPKKLSMWGNDQYGDCVSAQEAASKAAYSVYCNLPETFIPEATVIAWARKYGWLNGAYLEEVMDKMAEVGMVADDGKTYKDGPYSAIDFSNENELKAALVIGPVNIGMDADALPSGAGNFPGWYAFGGTPGRFGNEDHCCALFGYGSTTELFKQISAVYGVDAKPPANAPANGYLYFTWSTVGVVDHAWLMSTLGEAWVRNPTTPGQSPQPAPTPPVPPTPTGNGTLLYTLKIPGLPDVTGSATFPLPGGAAPLSKDMTLQQLFEMMQQQKVKPEKSSRVDQLERDLGRMVGILENHQRRLDKIAYVVAPGSLDSTNKLYTGLYKGLNSKVGVQAAPLDSPNALAIKARAKRLPAVGLYTNDWTLIDAAPFDDVRAAEAWVASKL